MKSRQGLKDLYSTAKSRHPDMVVDLTAARLEYVEERWLSDWQSDEAREWFAVSASATTFLFTMPLAVTALWPQLLHAGMTLAELVPRATIPGLSVALPAGAVALLAYYFGWPLLAMDPPRPVPGWMLGWLGKKLPPVHRTHRTLWVLVSASAAWLALGLLVSEAVLLGAVATNVASTLFSVILAPLMVILAVTPTFLLMVVLVLWEERRDDRRTPSAASLLHQLLEILADWPPDEQDIMCEHDFSRRLGRTLKSVADGLSRRPSALETQDPSTEWSRREYQRMADNLLVCRSWLLVPSRNYSERIRVRVVKYANALLTGDTDGLPRTALGERQGLLVPPKKRRIGRLILVPLAALGYSVAPLAVLSTLLKDNPFGGSLDAPILLMYSLWIAAGLYAFLENRTEDAASAIIDIVAAVLGR